MRSVLALIVLMGACEEPDDRWEMRSSQQVLLEIEPMDPDAPGLFFDDQPRFAGPNQDVWVEWWEERRGVLPSSREEWMRVQVQDVPIEGLTCADAATVTLWWDNVEWQYGIRIDPNNYSGEPIAPAFTNTGSQINDFGFIGGDFTVEHPCVAGGVATQQRVFTQWSVGNVERGLVSPPPDERR
jgi:hypothetical protein